MSVIQQVQQHPASVDAYIRHGWSLVPIPAGTKGPRTAGWNQRGAALASQAELPAGYGIGLAHAYSGTMALDIDHWETAKHLLGTVGIDLDVLYNAPDAVIIDSGRSGHGKLLYAMPISLPSKKILHNGITAYELRCATINGLTVQDVLPPSIHPETRQPYRWAGNGNWTRLPTIPEGLLDLWQELISTDKERTITTDGAINASWEEIHEALSHISPSCGRDEWINIGMALHWAGSQTNQIDQALSVWNEWSIPSPKYPGPREVMAQWNSFKTDKATAVKLGTLFHIAKQHGFTRKTPDVSELFKAIPAPKVTPTDLLAGLRPVIPEVDLDLFPAVLATRAKQISHEIGCDPLVPLFAGLSAVCGAIDARSRLELMPRFQVPPVLWLMTIGNPALKKSPASKPMMRVLAELEVEDRPRYQKEFLEWEGREAAHAASKKSFIEFQTTPDALLGAEPPPVIDLPPMPVSVKITVSDITSQKLVRQAADRPRGLLCYLDEMNSWVRKMLDKSGGEDRSCWVVSYESDRYEMERVGAGSIYCENLAVSIYGNIQPEVYWQSVKALAADGLLQRFIPAILREKNWGVGETLPDYMVNVSAWESTVRVAYALPPMVYKLSPEAFNLYRDFQHWYNDCKQDEILLMSGATYLTAFGKLEGTVGRLAFIWHVIENPFAPEVSSDTMARVIMFVRQYVIPAYRYAFSTASNEVAFENWVYDWIIQHADAATVTLSELRRSARRQIGTKHTHEQNQLILIAMDTLERAGWVIRLSDAEEHQAKVTWAIDPRLVTMFADHRRNLIEARQRQLEVIYKPSTKGVPKAYGAK